jgi:hypothetical protein
MHSILSTCPAGPTGLACQAGMTLRPVPAAGPGGVGVGVGTGTGLGTGTGTAVPTPGSGSLLGIIAQPFASAAEGLLKTLSAFWMNVGTPDLTSPGTPVATITGDLRWIVNLVAVGCILVAAARMAVRRRGEPVKVMLTGLARLVFVTAAATIIVQAAGQLGDLWSVSLMNSAHLGTNGWSTAISVTGLAGAFGGGDAVMLIIALLVIFSALIQLMLMVLRVGLLIVLTGTLPLAASASMCEWGEQWWRRHIGWLVAWLLYKPAAALLFAAAFALTNGKSLTEVLSGWMLLILSVLILPALLRLIVPLTAALGAASGGSLAMAATGAVASGALRAGGLGGMASAIAGRFRHGPSGSDAPAGGSPQPDDTTVDSPTGSNSAGGQAPVQENRSSGTASRAAGAQDAADSPAGTGTGADADRMLPADDAQPAGVTTGRRGVGGPASQAPAGAAGSDTGDNAARQPAGSGTADPPATTAGTADNGSPHGGPTGVPAGPPGAAASPPTGIRRPVPGNAGSDRSRRKNTGPSPSGAVHADDSGPAENGGTAND